jgi:hypothetical protein
VFSREALAWFTVVVNNYLSLFFLVILTAKLIKLQGAYTIQNLNELEAVGSGYRLKRIPTRHGGGADCEYEKRWR